jgi:hypothetical protein
VLALIEPSRVDVAVETLCQRKRTIVAIKNDGPVLELLKERMRPEAAPPWVGISEAWRSDVEEQDVGSLHGIGQPVANRVFRERGIILVDDPRVLLGRFILTWENWDYAERGH